MKATELRIGNYLLPNNECQDSYVEVVEIGVDFIICECSGGLLYRNPKPIPLTEEWLVKFGFEKDTYERRIVDSWFIGGKIHLTVTNGLLYNNYLQVNHVHQLQNLYHALTGEELNLKE